MSSQKLWYVLRVFTTQELSAEKQVKHLGYEAMAPYVESQRYIRKNRRVWKWPLFPGYLFASWPEWHLGWNHVTGKTNEADKINAIYGFLGSVWAPMPALLRPADVDYLQSIADGKYKPEDGVAPLVVGDQVLIPEGPFEGLAGKLAKIQGKNATVAVRGAKNAFDVKIALAKLAKM